MIVAQQARRQRFRPLLAAVVLLVLLAGCAAQPYPPPNAEAFIHAVQAPAFNSAAGTYSKALVHITAAEGVNHVLAVRVATTPQQRRQGLAGTPVLPDDTGLLIVYPEREHRGGITIDGVPMVLDIAFIDANGEIVSIFTGNPCLNRACTNYDPERPYHAVLQLPANWFFRNYVAKGDTVTWEYVQR